MTEQQKREKIGNYFSGKVNVLAIVLILLGIPFLFFFFLGILMIGYGIYLLVSGSGGRFSDDERIDAWANEDWSAHDFIARARFLAGFDTLVRDPLLIRGSSPNLSGSNVIVREKVGKDGRYRLSTIGATVLLCSDEQVAVYQTGIDLLTGNLVGEKIFEVFYQNISRVEQAKSTDTLAFSGQFQNFSLQNITAQDRSIGLTQRVLVNQVNALKTRYRDYIMNDILQRDLSTVYSLGFEDGSNITIPILDGRPTRKANEALEQGGDDSEVTRQMIAFRAFARDMKRRQLREAAAGHGALV